VKCTVYASIRPSTVTSRWLQVKWRYFRVTSGQLRSHDVISCHATASSCELQPCRKWNVQYTQVFCLLQPLPGDFRSNDVTSGSLVITWGHVTASPLELQPCRKWNVQYTPVLGLPRKLPGDFRWNDVTFNSLLDTWGHVTSFPITWLPPSANYSLVGNEMYSVREFSAFYSHFQVTSGQMSHFWVTFGHLKSCDVIFCHVTASSCNYSLVGS